MTANALVMKSCRDCRQSRPAVAFLPSRFTADGLTDRCKKCVFRAASQDRKRREARRASSSPTGIGDRMRIDEPGTLVFEDD